MTADELHRRTVLWFSHDDQDQPELPLTPGAGRAGAVFAFLRARGRSVRGAPLWDPVAERDVPLEDSADPGRDLDDGRAIGLALAVEGISHGAVALPEISLLAPPLTLSWDAGPAWDDPRRVAAFFDLLAALEDEAGVRPAFAPEDGRVQVGPAFEAIHRRWRNARAGGDPARPPS